MVRKDAKNKLDAIIKKSRVHFYKPIQIAEILYHKRICNPQLDLKDLESYRTLSKKWRDEISMPLLGNICTSSSKFQDDLFNAVPPETLYILGEENQGTGGAVEAYIYKHFYEKHFQMNRALEYCRSALPSNELSPLI